MIVTYFLLCDNFDISRFSFTKLKFCMSMILHTYKSNSRVIGRLSSAEARVSNFHPEMDLQQRIYLHVYKNELKI